MFTSLPDFYFRAVTRLGGTQHLLQLPWNALDDARPHLQNPRPAPAEAAQILSRDDDDQGMKILLCSSMSL